MSLALFGRQLRLISGQNISLYRFLSQKVCWKCSKNTESGLFCSSCSTILPPLEGNLFEYIGLPKKFQVDEAILKKRFRDLQFKLHPDKFAQSSDKEKELSEEHSRHLNKAYRTLLEPLARANYLLKLEGVEKKGDLNQETLMEMMEWNERVASLTEEADLQKELKRVDSDIEEELDALSEAFEAASYNKAKGHVTLLTYLYSLRNTVDRKLQVFLKN